MSFGGAFSEEIRRQFADRSLRPGCVIYTHCTFTTPPKNKYLLVVCVDPDFLLLVINSEINPFIQERPHLLCCQVLVPKEDHDFLSHDSHANCVEAQTAFELTQIREEIISNTSDVFRGHLTDSCLFEVAKACNKSTGIIKRHKNQIHTSISAELTIRGVASPPPP